MCGDRNGDDCGEHARESKDSQNVGESVQILKKYRGPIDIGLFLFLIPVGFWLGAVQSSATARGRITTVESIVRRVESPVAVPSAALANSARAFLGGIVEAPRLEAENRYLADKLQALSMYQEQIDSLSRQVDMLRAMQQFGPIPGKTRVPANIIGYYPDANLVVLNVGTESGITPGCPVITGTGLLGAVQAADARTSQVLMITDVKRTFGAIDISRKPPPAGLLRGESSSSLILTFEDPQVPVEIGDVIVTSGFSDKIPRGIFIGRVIQVEDSQELGTRRAKIFPTVSVGESEEVQVLR